MNKTKKDVIFKFRLTKPELEIIKNKAKALNLTTSAYIRQAAIK